MPRRKRYDKVNEYHLHRIERQVVLLRDALMDATLRLTPFREHYDAIIQLQTDLLTALNLLNDRPADYQEPHGGHMAQG